MSEEKKSVIKFQEREFTLLSESLPARFEDVAVEVIGYSNGVTDVALLFIDQDGDHGATHLVKTHQGFQLLGDGEKKIRKLVLNSRSAA
jgi:hypothetical protein